MDTKAVLTKDQAAMLAMIDGNLSLADSTKSKYTKALVNYWATGRKVTDTRALAEYAQTLSKSGRAFLKSAIRKVTEGQVQEIKGSVTPETVDVAHAALMRLEAIQDTIKVEKSKGHKAHTWLSQKQVKELFAACGNGIVGQRDKVVIGLLVGAGLRREEAVALTFDNVLLQPVGDKMRAVLDVKGKGAKQRTVPISDKLADALDKWRAVVGDGFICRSLGMSKEVGESLSAVAVFGVVRKRGAQIGKPELAPHDLRRTYAQLGYDAGVPIPQISHLLGHESIETTMRYLNLELDLETTVSDFIPFE